MDGRRRVREFLLGGQTDRPPFVPFALDFAAGLAQATREDLLADPHLVTEAVIEVIEVCGLDSLVLWLRPADLPGLLTAADPGDVPALAVSAEAIRRLRILLADRAAVGVGLPGPGTLLGSPAADLDDGALEAAASSVLRAAQFLQPPLLDLVGVVETEPVRAVDVPPLRAALAPLWNAVRFYSIPSLFGAAEAHPDAGAIGAAAVTVWSGSDPAELFERGAARVGLPISPEAAAILPRRPAHAFYTTPGEIFAGTDVAWVQGLATEIAFATDGAST